MAIYDMTDGALVREDAPSAAPRYAAEPDHSGPVPELGLAMVERIVVRPETALPGHELAEMLRIMEGV